MWWVLDLFMYRQEEWGEKSHEQNQDKDWYISTHLVEPHAQNPLSRKPTNINKHKKEMTPRPINGCNLQESFTKGKWFPAITSKWLKQIESARVCWVIRGIFLFNTQDCQQQKLLRSQKMETTVNFFFFCSESFPLLWHRLTKEALWLLQCHFPEWQNKGRWTP